VTSSLSESLGGRHPGEWAQTFLATIKKPYTVDNVRAIESWMLKESGGGGGMFNPLNTTQPWPGSTPYNWNGGYPVRNYATWSDGISANATAIQNGYYSAILAALGRGNDPHGVLWALNASPWGTHYPIPLLTAPIPGWSSPTPAPAPPARLETPMGMVMHPRGQGWAIPVPGFNVVLLGAGASMQGDQPNGRTRIWRPNDPLLLERIAQKIAQLQDIAPTVEQIGEAHPGVPNGRGIVSVWDIDGHGDRRPYGGEWS
jgi:hypothetical protein